MVLNVLVVIYELRVVWCLDTGTRWARRCQHECLQFGWSAGHSRGRFANSVFFLCIHPHHDHVRSCRRCLMMWLNAISEFDTIVMCRLRLRLRQDICIAPFREYTQFTSKADRLRSFNCHPHAHPQMEWAIPSLIPSRSASLHFVRYSFPVTWRVGGWVALGGWLHTEVVCPPKTITHLSANQLIVWWPGSNLRPLSHKSDALTTRLLSQVEVV